MIIIVEQIELRVTFLMPRYRMGLVFFPHFSPSQQRDGSWRGRVPAWRAQDACRLCADSVQTSFVFCPQFTGALRFLVVDTAAIFSGILTAVTNNQDLILSGEGRLSVLLKKKKKIKRHNCQIIKCNLDLYLSREKAICSHYANPIKKKKGPMVGLIK